MDKQVIFHNLSADRYDDSRGWIVNPFRTANLCGISPSNVHIVASKPGAIRGNHLHPRAREWVTIIEGLIRVSWAEPREDQRGTVSRSEMVSGPALIEIAPGVPHSLENCGERDAFMLAFNDGPESAVQTVPSIDLLGGT